MLSKFMEKIIDKESKKSIKGEREQQRISFDPVVFQKAVESRLFGRDTIHLSVSGEIAVAQFVLDEVVSRLPGYANELKWTDRSCWNGWKLPAEH